jgi:hypothetical protein
MTCDTPGTDVWTEGGGEPHGGPGLVKGHAYSLLQVCGVVASCRRALQWIDRGDDCRSGSCQPE